MRIPKKFLYSATVVAIALAVSCGSGKSPSPEIPSTSPGIEAVIPQDGIPQPESGKVTIGVDPRFNIESAYNESAPERTYIGWVMEPLSYWSSDIPADFANSEVLPDYVRADIPIFSIGFHDPDSNLAQFAFVIDVRASCSVDDMRSVIKESYCTDRHIIFKGGKLTSQIVEKAPFPAQLSVIEMYECPTFTDAYEHSTPSVDPHA